MWRPEKGDAKGGSAYRGVSLAQFGLHEGLWIYISQLEAAKVHLPSGDLPL